MSDITKEIGDLASVVAKEAAQVETPLQEKMDALDKLTKYMIASRKIEPTDGPGFKDFSSLFEAKEDDNGAAEKVRSHRRERNRVTD